MVNGDDGSDGSDVNDSECDGDGIVKRLVAKQKMFQRGKHLGTCTLGCIYFWQGAPLDSLNCISELNEFLKRKAPQTNTCTRKGT